MPVYARVADLPEVPELAVICTPPAAVPGLIAELGAAGTRAAVVLTAGLDKPQRQAMLDAAKPHLLRILGPNCIGMLVPHRGLNASFAHIDALPGDLAFVTQSGALMTAMLDWARSRRIGFSQLVSLGEHADVDFGDMLDFLGSDPKTRAILLYIESIEAPRKFMSAARAAARNKPVIVIKSGRSLQGQRAAASHTGALAGSDIVYDAAIARAGMLRVDTLQQLFLAAETLARFRANRGEKLVILTNGGGAGVMAADCAAHVGVELAELSTDTIARLDAQMPANWSRGNPVDIIGDAPAERYVQALEAINADPSAGAVLFVHAPTAIVASADIARALVPLASQSPPRVLGCWLGGEAVAEAREIFRAAGIAGYETPEEAGARVLDAGHLPAEPGAVDRGRTGAAAGRGRARSGCGACDRAAGALQRPRDAHRAGGEGAAGCLRHPGGAHAACRRRPGRGGISGGGDGLPGGAEDPQRRHLAQVRRRRCRARPGRRAAGARRRGRHAGAGARAAAERAHRRLHRAGDGAARRRAGADRRRQHRLGVRPGDPVRPGRNRSGSAGRPRQSRCRR